MTHEYCVLYNFLNYEAYTCVIIVYSHCVEVSVLQRNCCGSEVEET